MLDNLKLPWIVAILALLTAPLTACNTVEGVGEDVEAAGNAVEGSASRNKGY